MHIVSTLCSLRPLNVIYCYCQMLRFFPLSCLSLTDIFFGFYFSAINGFVFGNLPELNMCAQKRVAWHLFGMGNEVDVHTAFFHGQMLTIRGHHTDVAHIFPATFVTAEMVPQKLGIWLINCQVNSHLQGESHHLLTLEIWETGGNMVLRSLSLWPRATR